VGPQPEAPGPGGGAVLRAADGTPRLAYLDAGPRDADAHRALPVVLLHSLGTDNRIWRPQVSSLARRYRVLAPDSRGHGQSGWSGPLTVDTWVSDIIRVLDHAGVDDAVLVGVSMGGIQALACALSCPGRVRGVVIADSFARLPADSASEKVAALAGRARQQGMAALADYYVEATFTVTPRPAGAEDVRQAIAGMAVSAYTASAATCFGVELEDGLPDVACPALILWGERDTRAPRELSERLAAALPAASLAVIPAAGHLSNLENPAAFTFFTEDFLASLTRKADGGGQ
jgi:3-oxoadipate enol-lactonase